MRFVVIALTLILAAVLAAQTPGSPPASAPSIDPASRPAPVTLPSAAAETQPVALPATNPTTSPTTGSSSTAPSDVPSSGSTYRPFSSFGSSYGGRRDYFRGNAQPPTSYPSGTDFKPKPYPRQYSAMLSRSIFLKGSQRVFDQGSFAEDKARQAAISTGATQPVQVPTAGAESVLVFNGATDTSQQMVAFIENTGMNQISRYHVGDPVGQGAAGRITAITLDSIDYTVGPRVVHVLLGQNLDGQDTQVLTTQPVGEAMTAGGISASTQPGGAEGAVSDIERRMRERRMKELGQ